MNASESVRRADLQLELDVLARLSFPKDYYRRLNQVVKFDQADDKSPSQLVNFCVVFKNQEANTTKSICCYAFFQLQLSSSSLRLLVRTSRSNALLPRLQLALEWRLRAPELESISASDNKWIYWIIFRYIKRVIISREFNKRPVGRQQTKERDSHWSNKKHPRPRPIPVTGLHFQFFLSKS